MLKKLPVLILALTVLSMFKGQTQAQTPDLKTVKIVVEGKSEVVLTAKTTVEDFLAERGIILYDRDEINIDPKSRLLDKPIEIKRAFDLVISIDALPETVRVPPGYKIGNLLAEFKRERGLEYSHSHILSEVIKPDSVIKLYSMVQKTLVESEHIGFETEIIKTDTLFEGVVMVFTDGEQGLLENTYTVISKNNVEMKKLLSSSEIKKRPVNRIELHGTKSVELDVLSPPLKYLNKIEMRATGYSADFECTGKSPGHPGYGMTATGIKAVYGVVAVDPDVIPLGSRLFVEGYGPALAADTGGAIKGEKIDLFFESLNEARSYGTKTLDVYVLELNIKDDAKEN